MRKERVLKRQIKKLILIRCYCYNFTWPGHSKLNELFEKELNNFEILLVEHKDRLTRFGFNYIDILLKSHNKKIEVINLVDNNKEELIQDFVSVITSFCARIYSQRISKRKVEKLIEELEDESKENS